jgi:MOSC domain-containing protein YiiM
MPFGECGAFSAIDKQERYGQVYVSFKGLSGDEQADMARHGGFEKAVHHYPFDHYKKWMMQWGCCSKALSKPGAFGENISTTGITEESCCVGDIFEAGTAILQVSQARQPCWKLNTRFGKSDMAYQVQHTGLTGWYYRVIRPGFLEKGDTLKLLDRPCPQWPLSRLLSVFYKKDMLNYELLELVSQLQLLSPSWRAVAQKRLGNRAVEDWMSRLYKS